MELLAITVKWFFYAIATAVWIVGAFIYFPTVSVITEKLEFPWFQFARLFGVVVYIIIIRVIYYFTTIFINGIIIS